MRAKPWLSLALFALMFVATSARAEVRLVMFDQPGCVYCLRWDREVGDAYAQTDEGKAAPLWRIGLHDDLPQTITLDRPAVYTPTFILLDTDHREIGRIEGYPGEDFFWGLLGNMLNQLPEREDALNEQN